MAEPRCGCRDHGLGYLAWHGDAERRHKDGQRQVRCGVCGRWRWPDEVGPHAVTMSAREFAQMVKRAEEEVRGG